MSQVFGPASETAAVRRGGKVKFCGGCWFSWLVSLHPASAVSHLLTLSADCHSNGVRASGDGPKPLGETPVAPRCVWTRTEAMPRMLCALGWMCTYSINPIKTPFQWKIENRKIRFQNYQKVWAAKALKLISDQQKVAKIQLCLYDMVIF